MMRPTLAFILCCSMCGGVVSAVPKDRDANTASGSAVVTDGAGAAPRNLQVLPKDIPAGELVQLMVRYSQELGVQCQFCHAESTAGIDFASDQSPAKLTARVMIGMLRDINTKYLAQVGDRRYSVPLTCGNCHQGQTTPPVYEAKPRQ
jgi:Photosynthetic reaction centre cytochrome C subunit